VRFLSGEKAFLTTCNKSRTDVNEHMVMKFHTRLFAPKSFLKWEGGREKYSVSAPGKSGTGLLRFVITPRLTCEVEWAEKVSGSYMKMLLW